MSAKQQVAIVIIGGGMTGIAVARLLQLGGFKDFVVLEKAAEAGGLCRSRTTGGHVLDEGGGHFLCSKYPEVYDFIFDHLPRSEFNTFERVSKISLQGSIIDYPVEYNLWQLPVERQVEYLISCVRAADASNRRPPAHFEEWVRWKLGDEIADNYMIPYNRKIWGCEPERLDTDWLDKLPNNDARQIVRSCLDRRMDKSVFPSHQTFLYPKRGGFQAIFDALLKPVSQHVRLSSPLASLRRAGRNWIVNEAYSAELVVNTIPWTALHAVTEGAPAIGSELPRLQTSGLVVTLHEQAYDHNTHWTYIPDADVSHHREFYIRNFAPHSAPDGIFRETNARHYNSLPGTLAAHHSEHAYPIPLRGHDAAAKAVWNAYAEQGVIGVGRWGQHRYYNSDVCIREAMRLTPEYLARGSRAAADAMATAGAGVLT
jgi:protoporphyrinogen oxidase